MDVASLHTVVQFVVGLYVALLTWLGKRQINRIDTIEATQGEQQAAMRELVSYDDHTRAIDTLRAEFSRGTNETHRRLDQILLELSRRHHPGDRP